MTELLDELNRRVGDAVSASKFWPTSPRSLSNRVRRAAPLLRSVGLVVEFKHSGKRYVILEKTLNRRSTSSEPSADGPHTDGVDGMDDRVQADSAKTQCNEEEVPL